MNELQKEILKLAFTNAEITELKSEIETTTDNFFSESQPVIVRTYSAGVFYGYIYRRYSAKHLIMRDVRRIWSWEGAASLSELAVKGTSKPQGCKFPIVEQYKELTEVIEILPMSEQSLISLNSVPVWSSHHGR